MSKYYNQTNKKMTTAMQFINGNEIILHLASRIKGKKYRIKGPNIALYESGQRVN